VQRITSAAAKTKVAATRYTSASFRQPPPISSWLKQLVAAAVAGQQQLSVAARVADGALCQRQQTSTWTQGALSH
jgi:hypothetical protein